MTWESKKEVAIFLLRSYIAEANTGRVAFGDTELQIHELGCFVLHTERKTDTGTSLEHSMLPRSSSKGRIAVLHRLRSSSKDKCHPENIQHNRRLLNMESIVDA